jgi:hypothetical protein
MSRFSGRYPGSKGSNGNKGILREVRKAKRIEAEQRNGMISTTPADVVPGRADVAPPRRTLAKGTAE